MCHLVRFFPADFHCRRRAGFRDHSLRKTAYLRSGKRLLEGGMAVFHVWETVRVPEKAVKEKMACPAGVQVGVRVIAEPIFARVVLEYRIVSGTKDLLCRRVTGMNDQLAVGFTVSGLGERDSVFAAVGTANVF